MSEQEQLTQTIRSSVSPECTCGGGDYESMDACDCEEVEPTDAPTLAAALLASPWLAARDARIRAEAVQDANHLRNTWLGPVTEGRVYVDDKREADFRNAIRAATTELRGLADRAKKEN